MNLQDMPERSASDPNMQAIAHMNDVTRQTFKNVKTSIDMAGDYISRRIDTEVEAKVASGEFDLRKEIPDAKPIVDKHYNLVLAEFNGLHDRMTDDHKIAFGAAVDAVMSREGQQYIRGAHVGFTKKALALAFFIGSAVGAVSANLMQGPPAKPQATERPVAPADSVRFQPR